MLSGKEPLSGAGDGQVNGGGGPGKQRGEWPPHNAEGGGKEPGKN